MYECYSTENGPAYIYRTYKRIINSIDTKYFRWFNYLELLSRIMLTKLSFDIKLHKLMLL